MRLPYAFLVLVVLCQVPLLVATTPASGETKDGWRVTNHTTHEYRNELLRLGDVPKGRINPNRIVVKENGRAVPFQVEHVSEDVSHIWVMTSLMPGETHTYTVEEGTPATFEPRVTITGTSGNIVTLSNGRMGLELPNSRVTGKPSPILGVSIAGGAWLGSSRWVTPRGIDKLDTTILADGTLFARVRLHYHFAPTSENPQPAPMTITITLKPNRPFATIQERFDTGPGPEVSWVFETADGWHATRGLMRKWYRAPGESSDDQYLETELVPAVEGESTLMWLRPRWSPSPHVGWFFGATNNRQIVGAAAVRAGQWAHPYDSPMQVHVQPSGREASLHMSASPQGSRRWLLVAAQLNDIFEIRPDPVRPTRMQQYDHLQGLVLRTQMQSLNKLTHEYFLDYPGQRVGGFSGEWFYANVAANPTDEVRRDGQSMMQRAHQGAIPRGNRAALSAMQVRFDPDFFASYHQGWSPVRPQYATDFVRVPILQAVSLKDHPQFDRIKAMVENALKTDMHFAVTMPGGAGQASPSQLVHAMETWRDLAPILREQMGIDIAQWPRYRAAASFLMRSSVPDQRDWRRIHPSGEGAATGLGSDRLVALVREMGVREDVRRYRSEELPGFGAILRNHPGTPHETYLSIKAGPNRMHHHGDQLAIHHVAYINQRHAVTHAVADDIIPYQEHMHNRLAFHTPRFEHANMDGYERLIAFKSTPEVDVVIGQVESTRLRQVAALPQRDAVITGGPYETLQEPLVYRRTVVLVKHPAADRRADFVVIRDQYWGGNPDIRASYHLHVDSDKLDHRMNEVDFARLKLFIPRPARYRFERLDWTNPRGPRGEEKTVGVRLTDTDGIGEFITVLYPDNSRLYNQGETRTPTVTINERTVTLDFGRNRREVITFIGGNNDTSLRPHSPVITFSRDGTERIILRNGEIDLGRSQGEVGLFIPEAGQDLGPIPDWLRAQRGSVPAELDTNYLMPQRAP